jgi:hypothetical protein
MLSIRLINLEREKWTEEIGPTINEPAAENYGIVQTEGAISLVMCSSLPYSGWLAKQVSDLPFRATKIRFDYSMMVDDATKVCAQVAETDAKITDDEGFTYDLSAQWETAKVAPEWMFQVDNEEWTWTDTGIVVPASVSYESRAYSIEYLLDYESKRSAIAAVSVDGERFETECRYISARQEGWQKSSIVTQLQQCNNSQAGGYTLRFAGVGYDFGKGETSDARVQDLPER